MAAFEVKVLPPARRDLRRLDNQIRKTIIDLMRALARDPRSPGVSAIKGHRPYLRVRTGDYRIIYAVDDAIRG